MNDSLDPAWIAEQIALDPIGNDSEYNAVFRNDVDGFLRQEFVEACIVRGRHELPPIASRRYHAFTDASGGASDSFTLGISHLEDGIVVLDLTREVKPPFSHQNVVIEFAKVCKSYGCFAVHGDDYSGGMVKEMFRLAGVTYYKSIRTKSEVFLDLLPIINSGKCELLDDTPPFPATMQPNGRSPAQAVKPFARARGFTMTCQLLRGKSLPRGARRASSEILRSLRRRTPARPIGQGYPLNPS